MLAVGSLVAVARGETSGNWEEWLLREKTPDVNNSSTLVVAAEAVCSQRTTHSLFRWWWMLLLFALLLENTSASLLFKEERLLFLFLSLLSLFDLLSDLTNTGPGLVCAVVRPR